MAREAIQAGSGGEILSEGKSLQTVIDHKNINTNPCTRNLRMLYRARCTCLCVTNQYCENICGVPFDSNIFCLL